MNTTRATETEHDKNEKKAQRSTPDSPKGPPEPGTTQDPSGIPADPRRLMTDEQRAREAGAYPPGFTGVTTERGIHVKAALEMYQRNTGIDLADVAKNPAVTGLSVQDAWRQYDEQREQERQREQNASAARGQADQMRADAATLQTR